jgi:hypothetical protein
MLANCDFSHSYEQILLVIEEQQRKNKKYIPKVGEESS